MTHDRLTISGMVRKSTAEALGRNPATAIEIVAPEGGLTEGNRADENESLSEEKGCGNAKLEW